MYLPIIAALLVASSKAATILYVASYGGAVSTLSLSQQLLGPYSLRKVASTTACASNPSWLTLDQQRRVLYCIGEGLDSKTGGLTAFITHCNGSLSRVSATDTVLGGVNAITYGVGASSAAIAIAHYGGSALSTWLLSDNGTFLPLQTFKFGLPHPGPVPEIQAAPHPHQAVIDPTGRYIVTPDLGADLIRVFQISNSSNDLLEREPLKVKPGSGPRHAVFWTHTAHTASNHVQRHKGPNGVSRHIYLYVVTELANTLTGYRVDYPDNGGLTFTEVSTTTTFGNSPVPDGAAAAEIALVSQNRLLVSNRNDSSIKLPDNPGVSDSLASFSIHPNGTFGFSELSPAGGSFPRQFSVNRAGDLVAVGLQHSHRVAIFYRDVDTGKMGDLVAEIDLEGQITCVIWNEF